MLVSTLDARRMEEIMGASPPGSASISLNSMSTSPVRGASKFGATGNGNGMVPLSTTSVTPYWRRFAPRRKSTTNPHPRRVSG